MSSATVDFALHLIGNIEIAALDTLKSICRQVLERLLLPA